MILRYVSGSSQKVDGQVKRGHVVSRRERKQCQGWGLEKADDWLWQAAEQLKGGEEASL